MQKPQSIEHIGWDLWRATAAWKQQLTQEMVRRGFTFYGEARGGLVRHIGVDGISQAALSVKTETSKQAVQQQLDDLVQDGIVRRIPDPTDARKKRIELTKKGLEVFDTANDVKKEIEARYETLIGPESMKTLKAALSVIIEDGTRQ